MLKTNSRLIFSLLFSFFLACYVQHRVFFDLTAINDDVRNQIYWMARLIDPALFPHDYIASYFTQSNLVSPFVSGLYFLAAHWVSPVRFSQFLPFALIFVSTFFLFKTAESFGGSKYAFWISFTFNIYIWILKNLAGGLPRAFFYPLFFLFLWLLVNKHWFWMIFCFSLQALIYPVCLFISQILLLVELFFDRKINKLKPIQVIFILLAFVSSFLVLGYRYFKNSSSFFGHLVTFDEALLMPEFYSDGRVKIFPWAYRIFDLPLNHINTSTFHMIITVLGLIALLCFGIASFALYKKLEKSILESLLIPRYIWNLLVISISLYVIAFISLFYLYIPKRYLYYTLPLLVIFFIGSIIHKIESYYSNLNKKYIAWVCALLILILFSFIWRDDLIHIGYNEKEIYNYLTLTPKDSLVAAPLRLSDNIPLFSHRSVLFSNEANIPFYTTYEEEIETRIKKWKRAYYARSSSNIKKFIQRYQIDYLVVDHKDFQTKTNSYFAQKIPNACKAFTVGDYIVVSAQKCF